MSLIDRICRKTVDSTVNAIRDNLNENKTDIQEKLIEYSPILIGAAVLIISVFTGKPKTAPQDVHIHVTVNVPPVVTNTTNV